MTATSPSRPDHAARPAAAPAPAVRVLVALLAVAAAGTGLLAVGHLGVDVPLLSALGPPGDAVVVPAAIAIGAGCLLYAIAAVAVARRARWAWPFALAVSALAVLAGVGDYRGPVSAVGIAFGLVAIALLAGPARAPLRGR